MSSALVADTSLPYHARGMTLPAVDTDYDLELFISGPFLPDLTYLFARIGNATVDAVGEAAPGRVLDVGSGASQELSRLARQGWAAYAVEPSRHMLAFARATNEEMGTAVHLVRAIGERLPFADASLDAVTSQCALDHFGDRHAFMREAARVVKPAGRVVIALHNFDGLACRLGRLLHPIAKASRLHHCAEWTCWQIPPDHTFKGNWPLVRELGLPWLRLERAHGISLLTNFYGWGHLLHRLPDGLAQRLLRLADRAAYSRPVLSDVIVSVWSPAPEFDAS